MTAVSLFDCTKRLERVCAGEAEAARRSDPGAVRSDSYQGIPKCDTINVMKIGVSLPDDVLAFADQEAKRRGISRSRLLASLLEAEQVREQTVRYLDEHGWDVVEDPEAWRVHQMRQMKDAYGDDEW